MSYFACDDCEFTTLFEAGAVVHSKESGHAVIERDRPEALRPGAKASDVVTLKAEARV